MSDLKCELCPVIRYCPAYHFEESYFDLDLDGKKVVVDPDQCPLVKLIRGELQIRIK